MGSDFSGTNAPNISAYIIDPTNTSGIVNLKLMYGVAGSNVLPIQIASSNTNTLSFTDFSLQNGINSYYYIDALIGNTRTMSSPIWYTKNALVPLQLKSFTALLVNNNAIINFEVSNEQNILHYTIEKSLDGVNFSTIEVVSNKFKNKYAFTDFAIASGISFYRLKTVLQNGKFEYSNVISINNSKSEFVFKVYPNPAKDYLNLNIKAIKKSNADLKIVDAYGRVVLQQKMIIEKGTQAMYLDINKLTTGMYNVQCIIDGESFNQKFIKQ